MSNQDFGAILKADLRRATGDHRLTRRSIWGVGLKAPVKVKPGLAWVKLTYEMMDARRDLFVVYKPSPPRTPKA